MQERFARNVAAGFSQREAYSRAGFETKSLRNIQANACKLAAKPEVQQRIRELQLKQAQRIGITVEKLVEELDEAQALAMGANQPAAAVAAIMSKAKLVGLVTDKIEAEVRRPMREPGDGKTMSLEDWQAKFAPKGVQ